VLHALLLAVDASEADEELVEALTAVTALDWLLAALILAAAIVLSRVIKAITARMVRAEDGSGSVAAQVVGRLVGIVVVIGGLVYALASLGVTLGPLLGVLGIGGLALAFAAQAVLENTFASILLQVRRPFHRGDQIATGEIEGTVEDINFRTVNLRTYAGERVLIPCSEVLNNPIVNFTERGTRRTDLEVGVAYDTDLRRASDVLLRAVSMVDDVHGRPPPEVWVEGFGESSIDFVVRFWHAPDQASLWRTRSAVAMAVKRSLDDAGITIPFPQRTIGFLPGAEQVEVRTVRRGADHVGGGNGDASRQPGACADPGAT
jgi:small conductance mechanosensitive channel